MSRIYFDNAATTPIDPRVIQEMAEVMQECYGNPSSTHSEGRKAKTIVENARKKVAQLLGVSPGEIIFTSGGTEADNMAICCGVESLGIEHIISSPIEHHAVSHTLEKVDGKGMKVHWLTLDSKGQIDYSELEALLQQLPEGKVLVSLMHSNNELGNLLDIDRVGSMVRASNNYFHCDTVQTIGHLPIDLKASGIDFCAASAHKFNGPKGVGFIYINERVKISPWMTGGAQERNMRGGTENIYGITGLAKALEISYEEMEEQRSKIEGIKHYMKARLEENFSGLRFNGTCADGGMFTVLNVSFPPNEAGEMLLFSLDIAGVSVSGGSACSSGSDVGSHVLNAIGVDPNYSHVRFSFGKYNTKEEVDSCVEKLKEILKYDNAMA